MGVTGRAQTYWWAVYPTLLAVCFIMVGYGIRKQRRWAWYLCHVPAIDQACTAVWYAIRGRAWSTVLMSLGVTASTFSRYVQGASSREARCAFGLTSKDR